MLLLCTTQAYPEWITCKPKILCQLNDNANKNHSLKYECNNHSYAHYSFITNKIQPICQIQKFNEQNYLQKNVSEITSVHLMLFWNSRAETNCNSSYFIINTRGNTGQSWYRTDTISATSASEKILCRDV